MKFNWKGLPDDLKHRVFSHTYLNEMLDDVQCILPGPVAYENIHRRIKALMPLRKSWVVVPNRYGQVSKKLSYIDGKTGEFKQRYDTEELRKACSPKEFVKITVFDFCPLALDGLYPDSLIELYNLWRVELYFSADYMEMLDKYDEEERNKRMDGDMAFWEKFEELYERMDRRVSEETDHNWDDSINGSLYRIPPEHLKE